MGTQIIIFFVYLITLVLIGYLLDLFLLNPTYILYTFNYNIFLWKNYQDKIL